LVLLHALVLEQFKEAAFGFLVEGLYEGEALATRLPLVLIFVAPKAQDGFQLVFSYELLTWQLLSKRFGFSEPKSRA
jgi:hypothetical protein